MDVIKKIESLSASDRIRFIQLLESGSKGTSNNQNETPEASNSEGTNLCGFIEILKNVLGENCPESNLKGENSKKKQKTLDGWLIKLDNGSSSKDKVEQSSSKSTVQSHVTSHSSDVPEVSSHSEHTTAANGEDQSSLDSKCSGSKAISKNSKTVERPDTDINVNIENVQNDSSRAVERTKLTNEKYSLRASHSSDVSQVSSHSEHTTTDNGEDQSSLDSVCSGSKTISENSKTVERPDVHINVPIKNVQTDSSRTAERTKLTNEKYNLRRSKRKACELSPISDVESNVKHFKNTNNHEVAPSINDHDKTSDNTVTDLESLSHKLTVEEKGNGNVDSSFEKKNSNQRTKKKNSKLLQSVKTSNRVTVQTESNREIAHTVVNRNEPLLNISSSQKCNYEAFCLLRDEFSKAGLNIIDILQHENIQTVLRDEKSVCDDAVVFIGSFETQTKEIKPVVHLAKSKKILHEKLIELRK